MATSGTYTFNPSVGDLALNAFARIQVHPTALTQEHMVNLRMEANFLQAEWSNKGVSLWTVDLVSQALTASDPTYDVDDSTIMILDAYISYGSPATDRFITPLSRTDYASIAVKTQEGFPTTYWFDRTLSPTITLWQVPDDNGPYTLKYYRYRQIQDTGYSTTAQDVEVPYLFLDAWVACLAHRMARIYAPALEPIRKADAVEAWKIAANQNVENVPLYISPMIGQYYNR